MSLVLSFCLSPSSLSLPLPLSLINFDRYPANKQQDWKRVQRSTLISLSSLVSQLQSLEISVAVISDAMSKDDSVQDENDEQADEAQKEYEEGKGEVQEE